MEDKKARKYQIANALVWAAMIIASALLMTNDNNSETMLFLLIAGWLVTHNLVTGAETSADCVATAFKRRRDRR